METRIRSCLLGGMYGDALGGAYESPAGGETVISGRLRLGGISDDTQLTLATCASLCQRGRLDPGHLASTFLDWYGQGRLSGLGASTLKALRDLQVGIPWYSAGAGGDRSAGNGAAMRIAPVAFFLNADDPGALEAIREVCSITHRHDEAFVAALSVVEAIWHLQAKGDPAAMPARIAERLPDTFTRDRLAAVSREQHLSIGEAAARFGCSGYAVESIPFALFAASKIGSLDFCSLLDQVVRAGGDTDTNASIAGQIAGMAADIPEDAITALARLPEFAAAEAAIGKLAGLSKAGRA